VTYDALIVGSGPAGSTAAALLAKAGHRVALIGNQPFPREPAGIGWVGAQAARLLESLGIRSAALTHPIEEITFLSADLAKSATARIGETPGYFTDRAALENALIEAAASAGAETIHGTAVAGINLREGNVETRFRNQDAIRGRILLLASGRASGLVDRVGLAATPGRCWTAYFRAPAAGSSGKGRVTVILGLTRDGGHGVVLWAADQLTVAVTAPGAREDVVSWLTGLCRTLGERALLPAGLNPEPDRLAVIPPPANALEMETHVGKHALLIGEAGGFVAALSNEGVVPAMWSASVAAKVVSSALQSPRSQDALMTFDTRWRLEMADYLRSPNTDMQFLIPLVFSNQLMADRMAAAFFRGENI